MKKILIISVLLLMLTACQNAEKVQNSAISGKNAENGKSDNLSQTLTYGASSRITRINPLLDEHGEVNILLFNGLTAHGKNGEIVPSLAKTWEYDPETNTYTFSLEENVQWHDGESFTAEDVKFTIEAIKDPKNQSENAPNFEEVAEIIVVDPHTVSFRLTAPNAAFLDYMTVSILPKHALENENLEFSEFFTKTPIGTGPYKLTAWAEGQYITLEKNENYFKSPPKIQTIHIKFLEDDSSRFLQLQAGEIDLAQLTSRDAKALEASQEKEEGNIQNFTIYHMKTADYRGIMFNFNHPYWQKNRDLIPAINYALDREKMVEIILQGRGEPAYGPLQRNIYNNSQIQQYSYDLTRSKFLFEKLRCQKMEDNFYYRDGEKLAFTINVPAGDQVRLNLAQAAAQNLKEAGIDVKVEIPAAIDWKTQMAYLIGWGSPYDADDHTYKVFGTGMAANYSGYSNPLVDKALRDARSTGDPDLRREAYGEFQEALAADPPFAFLCYVDADYAAVSSLKGISTDTVLEHHGVDIFWNVTEWTLER